MVVLLISDAATPLGASLVTTNLHCLMYSTIAPITKDMPHPAAPTIMQLVPDSHYIQLPLLTNQMHAVEIV